MNTEINYNEEMNKVTRLAQELLNQIEYVNELRAFAEEKKRYLDLEIQDYFHIKEAVSLDAVEINLANKKISAARDARRNTKDGVEKFKVAKALMNKLTPILKELTEKRELNEEKQVSYVPRTEQGVEFLNEIKDYKKRMKKNIKVTVRKGVLRRPEEVFHEERNKEKAIKELEQVEKEIAVTVQVEEVIEKQEQKETINSTKQQKRPNRAQRRNKKAKLELQPGKYIIVQGEEKIEFEKFTTMLQYAEKNYIKFVDLDMEAAKRMQNIFNEKKKSMNPNQQNKFKNIFGISDK